MTTTEVKPRTCGREFHCIHNDRPAPSRTYGLRGLYAALAWVALWSVVIMGFIGHQIRQKRHVAALNRGRHFWIGVRRAGESVGSAECSKCGLDTRIRGVQMTEGPCPETKTSTK